MKLQTLNNVYYQNNNVNFKSKIVPTEFLSRAIDKAIERPVTQRRFYDSLVKILNDGKNDVVKFDFAKGKLLQKILPGAYNITVNGEKRPWNCFFGALGAENQCEFAVKDYAKDIDVEIISGKLDKIKKRYDQAWSQFMLCESLGMSPQKAEKYMRKKVEYLKGLYQRTLSEEFRKLKSQIFKPE